MTLPPSARVRSLSRNAATRRLGYGVATAAVAGLLLSGCGAPPEESAEAGSGESHPDYRACIVSDSGGFDDRSFNQSSFEGVKKAEADYGIQMSQLESQAATDFGPNMNEMVQRGCNLTISVGFLLGDTTDQVARANPEKHFVIVDETRDSFPDNVKSIDYDTAQSAFLAGYLAAATTKTGKVGTYGGANIPTVTIFMDGFADGVKYYNEQKNGNVELLGWNKETQNGTFVGNFEDAGRGKQNTTNFINEGADIVMPVAGPVGAGSIDAALEANAAGKDVKLIWVDSDGFETNERGKELMLTSVVKQMGDAVEEVIKEDIDGNFSNEPYIGTLENEGLVLAPFHDQEKNVSEETKSELEKIKQDIISGAIKVESASSPKS